MALPLLPHTRLRCTRAGAFNLALSQLRVVSSRQSPQCQAAACSAACLLQDSRRGVLQPCRHSHSAAGGGSRRHRARVVSTQSCAASSFASNLISAVQVPPGRDIAAMLFTAAGAVAWVKLFDFFARHEMLEQVRHVPFEFVKELRGCLRSRYRPTADERLQMAVRPWPCRS